MYLLTGEDNCLKDFENSPENNRRMLGDQDCPCDAEHMLSCPPGKKTIDPKSGLVDATNMGTMDSLDSLDLVRNIPNDGFAYVGFGPKASYEPWHVISKNVAFLQV